MDTSLPSPNNPEGNENTGPLALSFNSAEEIRNDRKRRVSWKLEFQITWRAERAEIKLGQLQNGTRKAHSDDTRSRMRVVTVLICFSERNHIIIIDSRGHRKVSEPGQSITVPPVSYRVEGRTRRKLCRSICHRMETIFHPLSPT